MFELPGFIYADMHTTHMSLLADEYCSGSLVAEDGFTGRIHPTSSIDFIDRAVE
jgi:hypothetical protein